MLTAMCHCSKGRVAPSELADSQEGECSFASLDTCFPGPRGRTNNPWAVAQRPFRRTPIPRAAEAGLAIPSRNADQLAPKALWLRMANPPPGRIHRQSAFAGMPLGPASRPGRLRKARENHGADSRMPPATAPRASCCTHCAPLPRSTPRHVPALSAKGLGSMEGGGETKEGAAVGREGG